jgi:hypothetical protein
MFIMTSSQGYQEWGLQPSARTGKMMIAAASGGFASGTPTPNGQSIYYSLPSGIQMDRWYEFEIHVNGNFYEAYVDGVKVITGTANQPFYSGAYLIGLINYCSPSPSFAINEWMDGFAFGSSRIYPASTIEISDNSNYGQGIVKYQEPLYLSDGTIQIKTDLKGLGSGPYYLYVTNNMQQRSGAFNLSSSQIYTVTPVASAHSYISPSSAQTVTSGLTTFFTVTADAGYTVAATGCGGSLVGTTFTTGAISSDCTVTSK